MSSSLTRSALVRQLSGWPFLGHEASRQDWAERLSHWVRPIDAIALQAASLGAGVHEDLRAQGSAGLELHAALQRQRQRICTELWLSFDGALALGADPAVQEAATATLASGTRYHRFAVEKQREMASRVASLRAQARRALSNGSPRWRQLAQLDAALERALAGQEQVLLSRWPACLGLRLKQLVAADAAGGAEAVHPRLGGELRQLLRAELQLRLEPVDGLIEALKEDVKE